MTTYGRGRIRGMAAHRSGIIRHAIRQIRDYFTLDKRRMDIADTRFPYGVLGAMTHVRDALYALRFVLIIFFSIE